MGGAPESERGKGNVTVRVQEGAELYVFLIDASAEKNKDTPHLRSLAVLRRYSELMKKAELQRNLEPQ